MSDRQPFTLAQVLSVTTERMLVTDFGDIYTLLNYMTGEDLFTHQLPRATQDAKPWIIGQYPDLGDLDPSGITRENALDWLAEQEQRFGSVLLLAPIPEQGRDPIDPSMELQGMVGKDRIVVVRTEADDE